MRKLPWGEQALVDDGLRRERADVTALGQQRFGFFAEKGEPPLETFSWARGVKRRYEKLPRLGHGFESAAAKAIGICRDAAPAEDAQAFLIGGAFHGGFCLAYRVGWEKCEAQAELFGEFDSLLGGFGFEEIFGEGGQESCAVSAGSVGIYSAAVGEAF